MIEQNIRDWYLNQEVQRKITQTTTKREVSLLLSKGQPNPNFRFNKRYLSAYNTNHIDYIANWDLGLKKNNIVLYNMYYSIIKFKNLFPFFKFGENRGIDIKNWISNKLITTIDKVDFFIDVDCKKESFEGGKNTIIEIKKLFDEYTIQYQIVASGKGFHIIANGEQFEKIEHTIELESESKKDIMNIYYFIAKYLKNNYSDLVDLAVYDLRRITKVPYSLVFYENETRVAIPFISWEEFFNYKFDDNLFSNVVNNTLKGNINNIKYRITKTFNKDIPPQVFSFLNDIGYFKQED